MPPQSRLREEDRSSRVQLDQKPNQKPERKHKDETNKGNAYVNNTLGQDPQRADVRTW